VDLEAILRHASEFNFIVTAFHHVRAPSWHSISVIHSYISNQRSGPWCMARAWNDPTRFGEYEPVKPQSPVSILKHSFSRSEIAYFLIEILRLQRSVCFGGTRKKVNCGRPWSKLILAFQANPWAGKILAEHNIPVAYKSDHPVPIPTWKCSLTDVH